MIHDTHCHLDLYPDPYQVASATEKAKIKTIAVTNLPSAYFAAKPHMGRFRFLNLAIGLHPLLADHHSSREKQLFRNALQETRYIGEIGLDFSKHGVASKEKQLTSFRFVLNLLRNAKRFVTLHSRRAESTVLQMLTEYQIGPVVFHWYSGSLKTLDAIVNAGHYFSVNTAMIQSIHGKRIINHIPKQLMLTETDGPFIKLSGNPVYPQHVQIIHDYVSQCWNKSVSEVTVQLSNNLESYLSKSQHVP
ncbi:Qat anti-phage system TatD family nuclease QatD [Candidatus Leptofilum sp.]|uniref:Qat anti-phage system TatD family nuclease QatD n=1 Tax=Candidatus Leptofilum sp. TaxID=3241576 RepID=UPI003B59DBF3